MASPKSKPPTLLIPGLGNSEKSFCKMCLVNNIGHVEHIHHKISAPHIKKLQAHVRLRSQCMMCRVYMSDIKSAEAHVQDSRHERRLNHIFNLKAATSVNQTYICPPCGLVFICSIALELHLFMTHKVRFSIENLPELSEIIWLLSGSSVDASKVSINPECVLCEVKCEAADDFLKHLISNVHMQSLRTSTCLVCEVKFIHVNDREGHLHGNKHKFHLRKFCLSKKLKKLKDMGQIENRGYICMYCMIWCKSWPCFMLHLMGSSHTLFAENQDQQHTNPAAGHPELQAEKVATIQDDSVSSMCGRNWKRWRDQPTWLSAWCLVCEEMVSTPEVLEKHLEGHQGLQGMYMKRRNPSLNPLSREGKACDYFECEVCCVIFKNELSLTVHKALRQHNIQQALMSNAGVLCCCFDCRMRSRSTAPEKSILLKSNSMIFGSGKLEENVTTVQINHANEINSEVKKEICDRSSNSGNGQGKIKILFEDKGNPGGHAYPDANETPVPEQKVEIDVCQTNEFKLESPRHCQQNYHLVSQEVTQSGCVPGCKEVVPVLIAAALPPSESIHNSIQTALELVKESLSAAVPKIRKSSTEVFSPNKRLKGISCDTDVEKHHCRSLQTILEAAVCEGLQSLISYSTLQEASTLGDCNTKQTQKISSATCVTPMSISAENVEGVSVAFAAAIIPRFSSAEIASQTHTSEKDPPLTRDDCEDERKMTKKGKCIGHQEMKEVRNAVQETNYVHNEKISRQDSTLRINTVYEEESSFNSYDGRVHLSPIETGSSED